MKVEHGSLPLSPDERAFVGKLRSVWQSPRLSGSERAEFLARLEARIERVRPPGVRLRRWVWALAAPALAAISMVVWLRGERDEHHWLALVAEAEVSFDSDLAEAEVSAALADVESALFEPGLDDRLNALLPDSDSALLSALALPAPSPVDAEADLAPEEVEP